MRQGLTAGSVAAIAAALASLPLHSPDDALFNTVTVVVGSLLIGLVAGLVWRVLDGRPDSKRRFAVVWTAGFAVAVVFSIGANTQLDRMVSFGVPMAAIVFALTGGVTIATADVSLLRKWWVPSVGLLVALAVGFAFVNEGDQERGRLELPPRATSPAVPGPDEGPQAKTIQSSSSERVF